MSDKESPNALRQDSIRRMLVKRWHERGGKEEELYGLVAYLYNLGFRGRKLDPNVGKPTGL